MQKIRFLRLTAFCFGLFLLPVSISAQVPDSDPKKERSLLDEQYISKVEDGSKPDKVLHAEPLYIDLIRDLGVRKGEHE
ncbi:MAG: hypothetical protein WBM43_03095 [Flavobacteriaceae bacterium]